MLELKNIKKDYPAGGETVAALKGIDLQFRQSEFVSILGPSGCGKTTLLNIIGGLDQYTSGDLVINGKSTKDFKDRDWDAYRNHSVGFVFQSYNLIPHQTVLQNVELALTLSGVSKSERRRRAKEALEQVGLGNQLKKKPSEMSGGQMQRVAIARAIVNNPDIILADEPTGALDTETSLQVMEILKEISKDRLIIMVTHNPELAEKYFTRIVRILDGRLTDDSAPLTEEELLREREAGKEKAEKEKKTKKPSMSFDTSFGLFLKNLFTKKGRTALTSFAGSIGIIGIALIYAVSQGTTAYIDAIQEDTLSSYPSITVVGQIMQAVLSGRYDTGRLAIMMTQTGGCCRASNYVGFIRRALDKAGMSHIPVISLNANGMEKNGGFEWSAGLLMDAAHAMVYGDLLMRCLYRVRPYEKQPGSANTLHRQWQDICIDSLVNPKTRYTYKSVCKGIVEAFDHFPIDETVKKPRVGIVGEILVKYMPLANNHLVDLLEKEGAEVVVPDMMDFFNYSVFGAQYKAEYLGAKKSSAVLSAAGIKMIESLRKPAIDALKKSNRFESPVSIYKIADMTKPFLSLGNQYGEGWFLAGEMVELLTSGTPNIVCIQPFACLPNHVMGKGVIKALKKSYPWANIAAVDYDPGASEVNQFNRIKLMLSAAQKSLENKAE